jgi:hypothetical protein
MRIKDLDKYDQNLTVGQLREKLELEYSEQKELEKVAFHRIKEEYSGRYFKTYENVFDKAAVIIKIDDVVGFHRDTEWDLYYEPLGTKISFSEMMGVSVNHEFKGSFMEEELASMQEISLKQYDEYLKLYNDILTQIKSTI